MPTRQRIKDFGAGLLLAVTLMSAWLLIASFLAKNPYRLNDHYTVNRFLSAMAYMLRSVAYEELLFRGALLYILIRRIGASRAVLASAIGFGIYHWFSYGVIGQPVQMLIVFLVTAVGGWVFAVAFEKTQSMYLAFALHLGYNVTAMILFSGNKGMGPQLLVQTFEKDPADTGTLIFFLSLFINMI
ncbi:MAG TPA: CPBP family intramembrane glutamic endopeptidase, partial [Chitinophagaceae bacterium]